MLAKALRTIYLQGGTLAVLNRSRGMEEFSSPTLVQAASAAARGDKGMAAGILNALVGACCLDDTEKAVDLMSAYDKLDDLRPDLVTLSLAYVATKKRNLKQANEYLLRAEQFYETMDTVKDTKSTHSSTKTFDWEELEAQHDIKLLQETSEFVVVSKPSGMVCYHTADSSTRRKKPNDTSLEECLLKNGFSLSTLNQQGRGFVHRIDRGTSGCLVLAKTNRMHANLITEFFLKRPKKSYQALICAPCKTLQQSGTIELNIDGRPASSAYDAQKAVGPLVTRIQVKTNQGRRHQVRLHCSRGLNAPILLDPLYGGQAIMYKLKTVRSLSKNRAQQRFCLHADTLMIPEFGIDCQAPVPDWWLELEQDLISHI
jgi:23S rRNA-/tRNA-specific pseudouridylate synthase